jgi:DNA processing protein
LNKIDKKFALALSLIDGIGPVKYQKIIGRCRDYEEFLAGDDAEYWNSEGISDKLILSIRNFNKWNKVEEIQKRAEAENVKIIALGDPEYPETLSQIYLPPIILYIKGDFELLGRPAVAVVGSRTPTKYGREMARKIAGGLASRGMLVISGMAWGIDAEAHHAALENKGKTAAIFGSGIDVIYPSQHKELAAQIQGSGYLLSEFGFGTLPDKFNFPRRNRIISGLARAVVVVEAAEKSGALVTADLAAEQGKDVFAVPGQVDNPKSQGTLNLLKQGASLATKAEDILESLGWEISTVSPKKPDIVLEPDEQKICDMVGSNPTHFDELVRRLGFNPSKLAAMILKLELAGVIVRRPGNFVARA